MQHTTPREMDICRTVKTHGDVQPRQTPTTQVQVSQQGSQSCPSPAESESSDSSTIEPTPPSTPGHSPGRSPSIANSPSSNAGDLDLTRMDLVIRVQTTGSGRRGNIHPEQLWERHKSTIEQLYIKDEKSLEEVQRFMAQQHDFHASVKMYKVRFKQWDFRKNIARKKAGQVVPNRSRRIGTGRPSDAVRLGRRVGNSGDGLLELATYKRSGKAPPLSPQLKQPGTLQVHEGLFLRLNKLFIHMQGGQVVGQSEEVDDWQLIARGGSFKMMQSLRHATMHLRARHLELGFNYLGRAFEQAEEVLDQIIPFHLFSLLFAYPSWPEAGITTAFWRYLAGWAITRPKFHYLGETLSFIYDMAQKNEASTFSELMVQCRTLVAQMMEDVYGPASPHAISAWRTLIEDAGYRDTNRLDALLTFLPTQYAAVDKRFGYGSPVSMQMRKWYFILEEHAGRAGDDESLEKINDWFADIPGTPEKFAMRVSRDRALALSTHYLNKCKGQPARGDLYHALGRWYLEMHCDILLSMYDNTDPELLRILKDVEALCRDAGDDDHADEVRKRWEMGESAILTAHDSSAPISVDVGQG